MTKIVTDFSGANDEIIGQLAGKLRSTHTFNARKQTDTDGVEHIKIKVINAFNYVTHVSFRTNEHDILQSCTCDGAGLYCGKAFCEHCRASYDYLKSTGAFPVFLPASEEILSETSASGAILSEAFASEAILSETSASEAILSETSASEAILSETSPLEEILPEESASGAILSETSALEEILSEESTSEEILSEASAPDSHYTEETPEEQQIPIEPKGMTIFLGTNKKTGEPVLFLPNHTDVMLNNNIGIIGTMGTGKTQFTKSLVTQLCRSCPDNYNGTPFGILIFDYKGDYNETKPDFMAVTGAKVIKPYHMPFNPLSLNLKEKNNKALLPRHTANAFKDTLSKIYNLGPKQEGILFDCIMSAYENQGIHPANPATWHRPAPTFRMVYEQYQQSTAFNDNDKLAVVMKKLQGFEIFADDPSRTVPLSRLLNGVAVIDISDYDPNIQNLVVAITLDLFYAQMQTFGSSKTNGKYRQIKSFILVDEADNFMRMNFPSLRKIMKEGREFGVGVILSTQSLTHFCTGDDDYSKYIITWVIHKVNDLNRRNMETVLDQTQKSTEAEQLFLAVKELKKHESMIKISGNEPVIMDDKPFWQLLKELS